MVLTVSSLQWRRLLTIWGRFVLNLCIFSFNYPSEAIVCHIHVFYIQMFRTISALSVSRSHPCLIWPQRVKTTLCTWIRAFTRRSRICAHWSSILLLLHCTYTHLAKRTETFASSNIFQWQTIQAVQRRAGVAWNLAGADMKNESCTSMTHQSHAAGFHPKWHTDMFTLTTAVTCSSNRHLDRVRHFSTRTQKPTDLAKNTVETHLIWPVKIHQLERYSPDTHNRRRTSLSNAIQRRTKALLAIYCSNTS